MLVYLYNFIFQPERFSNPAIVIYLIITASVATSALFTVKKIDTVNYKKAIFLLAILFVLIPIITSAMSGANVLFSYLLIITGILSLSIVQNFRISIIYATFCCLVLFLLMILQNYKIIFTNIENQDVSFGSMLVSFGFIIVITNIVRIGFLQIEKYYTKSVEYSDKLEDINRDLDLKVKERTKKIQDDFQKQVDSLYKSATIGDITKPLLHDLATPISVFDGSLNMLKRYGKYDKELVEALIDSTEQIKLIISESRDLMRGNDILEVFEANNYVQKVVKLLNTEFNKYEIEISFKKTTDLYVNGYSGLFERLIINILINSIEELKAKKDNRKISVEVKNLDKEVVVEIMDNGRGISKEYSDKIFTENFSLKHSDHNLGLGLPFVKKMINEKFNGDITFESEENKYTKFILTFELYEGKIPEDSRK